jgi:hypothetical protein
MEDELMRRPKRGALHTEKIAGTTLYVSTEFHFGDLDDIGISIATSPFPQSSKARSQDSIHTHQNADGLNLFTEVDFDAETLSLVAHFCD